MSLRDGDETRDVAVGRAERSWKVIARALLDGYDVARLQHRFPNVEQLLAVARDQYADEVSARVATADALALQLGWRLFGPFLRAATGLDDAVGGSVLDSPVTALGRIWVTPAGSPVTDRRSA